MKVLLDVIKTLLLINGAIVLPSFLLVMAFYEQQSTTIASAGNMSSKFHRNIQDDTPSYKQKLEKLEAQKNQLQAKLEASQGATTVTPVVANGPSANSAATQVTPVSQLQAPATPSKPSVKRPVLTKVARVSPNKTQSIPSQPSVGKSPGYPSQNTEVAVVQETRPSKPLSQVNVAENTSTSHDLSAGYQSSDQGVPEIAPTGFVSVADLNKTNQQQAQLVSYSIIAPQAKTPIEPPITLANDLSVGLIVADKRNELNYGTRNYKKVQTAILSLRKGNSQTLEEAAKKAGIDPDTLKWLAHYGQNRPGSFNPPQISMINPE
ncbi:hypothetical protein cce_3377 [Crocosphaera subtropica ATCC 51142]|uniref:Uncharacterized protein n=1 Tax=Crocosphaera subtropica (strain ATCC 51142 / BH68) TaxID=43989 RepID=B1WYW1_CROS5|nr:hypothetical protein [Crocosphaera subtropica]ACB52725.1 hypothetical protein cce_3377 [Crocosphaera subtropica ATCC 51142]